MKLYTAELPTSDTSPDIRISVVQNDHSVDLVAETADGLKGLIGFFRVVNGKLRCESVNYSAYKNQPNIGNFIVLDDNGWVDFRK